MDAKRRRYPRFLGSAALVVVWALVAVPIAHGAKPDRSVLGPSEPSVSLAGEGCAFDILWQPSADARRMITQFDDGRTVYITNGNPTLTNLESGATFAHRARYHVTDTYDPGSNSVTSVVTGQIILGFWPGDQGPYGVVSYPGLVLRVTGIARETLDLDTFAITNFSLEGTVTDDVCAVLAG
jgi:hypothetical protein